MRKVFAIAALGLLTLSLPALATVPTTLNDNTPSTGAPGGRVECPGTVIWDTGMYDEFTPPTGCSSAYSTGCFINAIDEGAFGADWRQGAAQFIGVAGDPITNLKFWTRYNQQGYDYHLSSGGLHGFCVRIYDDPSQGGLCPDGTIPDALGAPVYDQYVDASHFVEEEIFTGVVRNFNVCVSLPVPFHMVADHFYWVNVSGDFDFTNYLGAGVYTQLFHRMAPPGSAILCEPVVNYDSVLGDHQNWKPIWAALNIACWQGWDASMKIYTNPVVENTGACCIGTECRVVTAAECANLSGNYMGDNVPCDPNPCATPTKSSTWGKIKAGYR
jgi:hypothetical protein